MKFDELDKKWRVHRFESPFDVRVRYGYTQSIESSLLFHRDECRGSPLRARVAVPLALEWVLAGRRPSSLHRCRCGARRCSRRRRGRMACRPAQARRSGRRCTPAERRRRHALVGRVTYRLERAGLVDTSAARGRSGRTASHPRRARQLPPTLRSASRPCRTAPRGIARCSSGMRGH